MALKSVYIPDPVISSGVIRITGDEHRHLAVARADPGERLEMFDGKGGVWTVVVLEVDKRQIWAKIENQIPVAPPSFELILGQALIRTAAFELAIEKAVEVGVTRIIPFIGSRSNVALTDRQDRWQRIVVEAAKQSKRYYLPVLEAPVKFNQILDVPAASRIMFTERNGGSLKSATTTPPVLFIVGPEGGWTDDEIELAGRAGFRAVSLGFGILRSETATTVGAALIRQELGDM